MREQWDTVDAALRWAMAAAPGQVRACDPSRPYVERDGRHGGEERLITHAMIVGALTSCTAEERDVLCARAVGWSFRKIGEQFRHSPTWVRLVLVRARGKVAGRLRARGMLAAEG